MPRPPCTQTRLRHQTTHTNPFLPLFQSLFAQELGFHIFRSILLIGYDFFMLHKLMLSPETLVVILLALLVHPLTAYVPLPVHPITLWLFRLKTITTTL